MSTPRQRTSHVQEARRGTQSSSLYAPFAKPTTSSQSHATTHLASAQQRWQARDGKGVFSWWFLGLQKNSSKHHPDGAIFAYWNKTWGHMISLIQVTFQALLCSSGYGCCLLFRRQGRNRGILCLNRRADPLQTNILVYTFSVKNTKIITCLGTIQGRLKISLFLTSYCILLVLQKTLKQSYASRSRSASSMSSPPHTSYCKSFLRTDPAIHKSMPRLIVCIPSQRIIWILKHGKFTNGPGLFFPQLKKQHK